MQEESLDASPSLRFRAGLGLNAVAILLFIWSFFILLAARYEGQVTNYDLWIYSTTSMTAFILMIVATALFIAGTIVMVLPKRETRVVYVQHQPPQQYPPPP
jgi:hypothetical protein